MKNSFAKTPPIKTITNRILVLFLGITSISFCYSQEAKDHPFLLISKNWYAELIMKQDTYSWSKMKNNAQAVFDKSYITTSDLTTNCMNIQNLVAANALLYILDQDNKETYIQNAASILDKIDEDTDLILGDDQFSSQAKDIGSCYFVCLIAMEIMYDDWDIEK